MRLAIIVTTKTTIITIISITIITIRFWMGEHGERLANPFVLCLNLVGCRVEGRQEVNIFNTLFFVILILFKWQVAVKYKFGIYNRCNEEFEMGSPEKVRFKISNPNFSLTITGDAEAGTAGEAAVDRLQEHCPVGQARQRLWGRDAAGKAVHHQEGGALPLPLL